MAGFLLDSAVTPSWKCPHRRHRRGRPELPPTKSLTRQEESPGFNRDSNASATRIHRGAVGRTREDVSVQGPTPIADQLIKAGDVAELSGGPVADHRLTGMTPQTRFDQRGCQSFAGLFNHCAVTVPAGFNALLDLVHQALHPVGW